ncbi:LamG-like jellyroll fold domain-containing protein, partial [Verrucomicrobiota bacterium]
ILTVKPDSSLTLSLNGKAKQVALRQGGIDADVVKQSRNSPMLFVTRHAEVQVLGTKINLNSVKGRTDVATINGKVRIKNKKSGAEETISAGQVAEVFKDAEGIRVDDYKKDPSLIGWWRFDELEGLQAADSSGNEYHGKLKGATWMPGRQGGAIGFKEDDHLRLINLSDSQDDERGATLVLWIKLSLDSFTPKGMICNLRFGERAPGAIYKRIHTVVEVDGGISSGIVGCKGSGRKILNGGISLADGKWHHFALACEESTIFMYLDGQLTDQEPVDEFFSDPEYLDFGLKSRRSDAKKFQSSMFPMVLDDVRLYTRTLSESEIQELAEAKQ